MKIAIVNQPLDGVLPPEQNSIGIWTYEVARRISPVHDVTVYSRHWRYQKERGTPRTVVDQGVAYRFSFAAPVRVWAAIAGLWSRLLGPGRPVYASILYYLEFSLPAALRIRRHRPDVIHVHNFTGFVPIVRLFNRRAKVVLHMNCEWLSQLDERRMGRRIAKVDAVLGSSDHITGLVRRRFPQFADRCHTVYNGVDAGAFVASDDDELPADDRADVVFVGRVSPEKGVHDLIDAMAEVTARHPGTRLDLIGPVGALDVNFIVAVSDDPLVAGLRRFYPGDYGEALRGRAEELGLRDVRFLGGIAQSEVARHVRAARLLVNPSYSESFGMSLVEAMACEVPVVASRVGGMPEIVVDGVTGLIVDPAAPAELAAAIAQVLDDPERATAMGASGRARVEDVFTWDRIAERATEEYGALLGGRRPEGGG